MAIWKNNSYGYSDESHPFRLCKLNPLKIGPFFVGGCLLMFRGDWDFDISLDLHVFRECSICLGAKAKTFSHFLNPSTIELPSMESSFFVTSKTAGVQIKYYFESISFGFVLHSELKLGNTSYFFTRLTLCLCLVYPFSTINSEISYF